MQNKTIKYRNGSHICIKSFLCAYKNNVSYRIYNDIYSPYFVSFIVDDTDEVIYTLTSAKEGEWGDFIIYDTINLKLWQDIINSHDKLGDKHKDMHN